MNFFILTIKKEEGTKYLLELNLDFFAGIIKRSLLFRETQISKTGYPDKIGKVH
jgi:hypothetical protein